MFHIVRSCIRQSSLVNGNYQLIRFGLVWLKYNSTVNIVKLDHSKCLGIMKGCQSMKYHYFWLRDHCRCNDCYNRVTAQRKLSILEIPNEIKPESVHVISNEVLRIIYIGQGKVTSIKVHQPKPDEVS